MTRTEILKNKLEAKIAKLQAELDDAKKQLAMLQPQPAIKKFAITYTRNFVKGATPRIFTDSFEAKTPEEATEKLLAEMESRSRRLGMMPYWEILTITEENN